MNLKFILLYTIYFTHSKLHLGEIFNFQLQQLPLLSKRQRSRRNSLRCPKRNRSEIDQSEVNAHHKNNVNISDSIS